MYNYKGSNGKQHSLVVHLVWDQGVAGSNPVFPTIYKNWGHSSAGRAPALHAGGQRFDPAWLHQFYFMRRFTQVWLKGLVLKTSRGLTSCGGSNPSISAIFIFWSGSSAGQNAALSRRRSRVRVPSRPPVIVIKRVIHDSFFCLLRI